jgi:hypothetical protein
MAGRRRSHVLDEKPFDDRPTAGASFPSIEVAATADMLDLVSVLVGERP